MIRLYTEDVNRAGIESILDTDFPTGYTVIPAQGHWQGVSEPSLVVELATASQAEAVHAAEEIKTANKQESVMVANDPNITTQFV
jgi:hypothetical protein